MDRIQLQKLRDLPIEGVAERLGLRVVRHKALCPFHDDHHASLSFKVSKNTWRCFVCGASGGTLDLVSEAQRRGPKNMLDSMPDTFNEAQLKALRVQLGKSEEGANAQLRQWVFRKFIEYSAQTGLYSKTEEYLKGKSE